MFPKIIQIETTTLCPSKCIMCPHKFVARQKFMPMPLIEKILDECAGKDVTIMPHQMGDPIADNRIMDILKKCKDRGLKILMSTAGILLDKEKSKALVDIGVDTINISLDSLNKKTYERIRKVSFDTVMKNVEDLLSVKRAPTEVWISAVDMFFDKKTRLEFIDYWKDTADRVQISPYVQYPRVRGFTLPRKKMKNLNWCQRLENDMIILTNGEAAKCCIDFEGTTSFGNANTTSLAEIWAGSLRRDYIEKMKAEKRKSLYPCKICVI
ncbi:MAG: radical SAM protein [Candidatus Omnitrophica bacterium]|nr:radical SAM protein [Candidatus Omnitrophota bacterium]